MHGMLREPSLQTSFARGAYGMHADVHQQVKVPSTGGGGGGGGAI